MNHKHEVLRSPKNCKLYILCALILSTPPHLTVGSKLILTQNELEFKNMVVYVVKFFTCV